MEAKNWCKPEEIEITPDMVEVGAIRLLAFSRETDLEDEAVKEIFLAMWRLRPRKEPTFLP